ncbi:MAG: Replicative DNA helicase (DnaB), partial [uncultured Corynebacteriales bacterium]
GGRGRPGGLASCAAAAPLRAAARVRPAAPAGHPGRAVGARRHAAVQGRHRRRRRGARPGRLLPPGPPDRLRHHPRPLRARRAGRPGHRLRRAHPLRPADAGRRRALPAHADLRGAHGGQRRVLRGDRRRAGHAAPAGRGRHPDRPAGLRRGRRPGRRRRPGGRPGPGRDLRRHRAAHQRGLRPAGDPAAGDDGRDRRDLLPRRRQRRRAHRLLRAGPDHQRPALRPDGDHRGPAGDREVDPGPGLRPGLLDQARPDLRHLLAGDEQVRDHHAAAVGRGQGGARAHAVRAHERRRLGPAGPADGRGRGRAALHRRLAQPDDDGDPGQGPADEAAARPAAGDRGLPAADDQRQAGGEPPGRGLRVLPVAQAAGQGAGGAGGRAQPAQPRPRAAHRQEADAVGPARVRVAGAGRGHGPAAAPRGRVRAGVAAGRRGRPDPGQAPQRPDRHGHRRLPGALLALRRHGLL